MGKKDDIYYNDTVLSENLKKIMLFIIMFTLFYIPKIGSRDYIGIIILYAAVIFVILNEKINITKVAIPIIIYSLFTIIIDLSFLYKYPASYSFIIRIFIYAFIPIMSFLLGSSFSKNLKSQYIEKIMLFLAISQGLIGILQQYSYNIRILTLKNYSSLEKYNYGFEAFDIGRIVGTIGNPNTYGIFMILMVIFLINVLLKKQDKSNKLKFITWIAIGISIYAILLTQSRTAYLLLLLSILLSILTKKENLLFKIIYALFFIVVAYIVITKIPFLTRRFKASSIITMGSRSNIWDTYINRYLLPLNINTIFGYGLNYVRSIGQAVDNYYLQIVMQYGIVGLILYIAMILKILFSFNKNINSNIKSFIIIGYIIVLISDITGSVSMIYYINIPLYFLLGYYQRNKRYLDN